MRLASAALLILLTAAPLLAQEAYVPRAERGSLDARTQTDLDGNRVLFTVFNFGQTGRTSARPSEIPYEWPSGTRRNYLALTGLFVGAAVESETGETSYIVNVPNYRQNPSNPSEAWTWVPVPEYLGNGEVARSDRPETWPAVWPDRLGDVADPGWTGSWNGLLGKGAIIDGVEVYTHYTDDQYVRNRLDPSTTYYPDSTDLDRAGLGIVVSERRLAFRAAPVEDAVFTVRDLYNAGTEDLQDIGATIWVADLIGGDADAGDDAPIFDATRNLIVFADRDGQSTDPAYPDGQSVGAVALVLLEAPGELAFVNVQDRPAGGINFQTISDEALYSELMTPAPYTPPASGVRDDDTFASVGQFSLQAGASARLATALVFGEVDYSSEVFETRYAEILLKAQRARAFYAGGFTTPTEGGPTARGPELYAAAPNPASGDTRVTLALPLAQPVRLEVFDLLGRRVAVLADGVLAAGARVLSGVYLLRLTTPTGVQTRPVTRVR